jgi:hypothetical protein
MHMIPIRRWSTRVILRKPPRSVRRPKDRCPCDVVVKAKNGMLSLTYGTVIQSL